MLIAEIHGKRFPEAEGQEDWLTSAVFGHLRHIPPGIFWPDLFNRAFTIGENPSSLYSRVCAAGVQLANYSDLDILFWKCFDGYGEPDIILQFSGGTQAPLIVIVEVKLNSGKSGVGEDDQLKRYLELMDDRAAFFPASKVNTDQCYLVYLTRNFAKMEIEDSVNRSVESGKKDAAERLYGLQWQDVLECAEAIRDSRSLLEEVAEFLKRRGFEAFRGFNSWVPPLKSASGAFYGSRYFGTNLTALNVGHEIRGKFYADGD
jgi:Holliday junction resolvase-like predicted endonuclease